MTHILECNGEIDPNINYRGTYGKFS
uniref:Uncharacterized protein n=1 Tax=Rhizophora mucronata TaxID=61149 RepID=A0A2P2LJX5_RHIMU